LYDQYHRHNWIGTHVLTSDGTLIPIDKNRFTREVGGSHRTVVVVHESTAVMLGHGVVKVEQNRPSVAGGVVRIHRAVRHRAGSVGRCVAVTHGTVGQTRVERALSLLPSRFRKLVS